MQRAVNSTADFKQRQVPWFHINDHLTQ